LENNIDIDNLIGKYLSGEAHPDEAIYLEDWKASNAENLKHFEAYEKLYDSNKRSSISDGDTMNAWKNVSAKIQFTESAKPAIKVNLYWALAASVALMLGLSVAVFFYFSQPKQALEYVALNTSKSVKLDDDSEIEVYKNSSIQLDENYDKENRTLRLNGSAQFKVIHNAAKPFIVNIGSFNVKDVGTKFKILSSNNKDTITVIVEEGIVLAYDNSGFKREVGASQKIVYLISRHELLEVGFTQASVLKSFNFNNSSLNDVVAQLSAAYGVPVSISNAISDCRITAQFKNESLENVLLIVSETLGLETSKSGKGFTIIGDQCKK
jgi:transmembrane sensor